MTALEGPVLPVDEPVVAGIGLTPEESSGVLAIAERLFAAAPGLVDHPDWLAQARREREGLPERLRDALRSYRRGSGCSGVLVIGGLPVNEHALPETPAEPDSVERRATVPASILASVGLLLGEPVAYRDEKHGAFIQNVVPVPGREETQSNAGSVPLQLHVENAFHPRRPDHVGLLCLREHTGGRVGTVAASIRRALPRLLPDDVRVLSADRFATSPPPSFRVGTPLRHPVLSGAGHDVQVIADFNATRALDPEAADALQRLHRVARDVALTLTLRPGELAWIDNRVVLHGRTGFRPAFDRRDRWLHRLYLRRDDRGTSLGDGTVTPVAVGAGTIRGQG